MNFLVVALFVIVAVADLSIARPDEKYRSPRVDIDEILHSERLLKNYLNCLTGKSKCAPDAADLKRILPEALENDCAKCEEEQRAAAIKVIRFLIDNKPEWWKELSVVYDPEGTYLKKYKEQAKKENINV